MSYGKESAAFAALWVGFPREGPVVPGPWVEERDWVGRGPEME